MCENTQLIERLRRDAGEPARVVIFDFDGTIGMVRAGWMPLMLDMMMETLGPVGPDPEALRAEAEEYVAHLTGRDTVEQMNAFVRHVEQLGGCPRTSADYKAEFLGRLEIERGQRLDSLRRGMISPDRLMVPGARRFLIALRDEGIPIYLASGSEHSDICMEADLLGISGYFQGIYGAASGVPNKKELLELLLGKGIAAAQILTFGDGRTEIELTCAIGGRTIGVASDEPECVGVEPKKRRWLIDAGADYIIPNYLEPALMGTVTWNV